MSLHALVFNWLQSFFANFQRKLHTISKLNPPINSIPRNIVTNTMAMLFVVKRPEGDENFCHHDSLHYNYDVDTLFIVPSTSMHISKKHNL